MSGRRAVLIGCGAMSEAWLRLVSKRDDVELCGLVDVRIEAAREKARRLQLGCPAFSDLKSALEGARPELVLDTCLPETRFEIVTTALEAGCDVLAEKPMAASLGEARGLVDVADRTGRAFSVMQNRRYLPAIRALRETVCGGAIGSPGFVCADFFLGPHFGGFRDTMESPLLVDMAIHTFDQARFITGADPVSVYCEEFNLEGSWYEGNASAVCIFELTGGVVFCYRGSWSAEGAPTSWEAAWRVVGSRGSAIWDGGSQVYAEVPEKGADGFLRPIERLPAETDWRGRREHAGCIDEMLAALAEGRVAETDCRDNFASVAMVFAALESARSGKRVPVARLEQQ